MAKKAVDPVGCLMPPKSTRVNEVLFATGPAGATVEEIARETGLPDDHVREHLEYWRDEGKLHGPVEGRWVIRPEILAADLRDKAWVCVPVDKAFLIRFCALARQADLTRNALIERAMRAAVEVLGGGTGAT